MGQENNTGLTVFDLVFPDLVMGENSVICPFHPDKNPSMQINTVDKIYHCFGCGRHGTENDFCMEYYGVSRDQVSQFKSLLLKSDSLIDYEQFARDGDCQKSNFTYLELVHLGVPESLLEECKVGIEVYSDVDASGLPYIKPNTMSTRLVFPIIIKDRVIDHRAYTMEKGVMPKAKSDAGVPGGLVLPYHLWIDNLEDTIICEGEKDMLFARMNGYNAISLGGCNNVPYTFLESFRDRKVYIVYDNDNAGRAGAIKLANALYSVTKHIYIANIGEYCKEDKEDITDFFTKYGYKKDDFEDMLSKAKAFDSTAQEQFIKSNYPEVSLNEASTTYLGKIVRSNVQVMATFEEQYSVPSYAMISKNDQGGNKDKNMHSKGDTEYWSLQKSNFEDILVLTDNNLKEYQIKENIKQIMGWGYEEGTKVTMSNPKTIFKASVADCTESIVVKEIKRTEFVCYTDVKLEAGKNYQLIYKVVPHPYKGQQQVLIVLEVKESNDVIAVAADVTPKDIESLRRFQGLSFKELVERQKAYVKFNVNNTLLAFIDLWYHTPKAFNFGLFDNLKGYLDGLIITESRVGKSTTAQELSKIYGLGAIASLAGSSATPAGLVGGSVGKSTYNQIRPGLIPRQHNKAIIFEELAKAKYSLMPELTDIRSSGLVRINRSVGDLTLPASVRMLFLTNPKMTDDGIVRPIISYPNGIEIIKPLIPAVEDIARFDFIYILGENPGEIDPLWKPLPGFATEDLQTRIRWIWSRKTEQVILTDDITKLIVDYSKVLNDKYQCSVKIFSTETWKKVARLAIAIAGYMVSTNMDFTQIVVRKEHVKLAVQLLVSIYDNSTFKLKEFVDEERKTLVCNLTDINFVKEQLKRFPSLFHYLENNDNIAKSTLYTISGCGSQEIFNNLMQNLTTRYFIQMSATKISVTPKLVVAIKKAREALASEGGTV